MNNHHFKSSPEGDRKVIFITGASGFLGFNLLHGLKSHYRIIASAHTTAVSGPADEIIPLDLEANLMFLKDILQRSKVDTIIHAAAMAQPDDCEKTPEKTFRVNTEASADLCRIAKEISCRFILISTDLVYGDRNGPHIETQAIPHLIYAKSKYEAEQEIFSILETSLVFRCSLMYGPDDGIHGSFIRKMHDSIHYGQTLRLFVDQIRTPLWAPDVISAIHQCIEKKITGKTYNLGGPDRISRYDFGCLAAQILNWDRSKILGVKMDDLPQLAFRSHDCSLDSSNAIRDFDFQQTSVIEGLRILEKLWNRI